MKQVTINIPEKKFSFFMKLMRSLDFVKIIESPKTIKDQLNSEQIDTWENIRQGFEELKMAEAGKIKSRPIQDLINEL